MAEDKTTIEYASKAILHGNLVGIPTETVYGLAADATNSMAVAKIFALKQRPHFNPLIVHFKNLESTSQHVRFSKNAIKLAENFWPGPLTLILPITHNSTICELVRAGLPDLAVRVPNHTVSQTLLHMCNVPLAAPSANVSGKLSPTSAQAVRDQFGKNLPVVLEGGNCKVGLESTIIGFDAADTPILYRTGYITKHDIEQYLGLTLKIETNSKTLKSPGQLLLHYAPNTPLCINAMSADKTDAYLGFGTVPAEITKKCMHTLNLSPSLDLVEAASNLFEYLRILDGKNVKRICVAPIPNHGLGEAINDRLSRGANSFGIASKD